MKAVTWLSRSVSTYTTELFESVILNDAFPAVWPVTVNEQARESVENDKVYAAVDEYDAAVKLIENAF